MARIEILVEELSMKEFLNILLPRVIGPPWVLNENYFIRSFEGKSDLQKNIPSKIKTFSHWKHESIGIIILHDQDSSDCKILKDKLVKLCKDNGTCPHLIRIVCKELEAWYLGDFMAITDAYSGFKHSNYSGKAKYRNPDLLNASDEMRRVLPEFQKVSSAKKIAHFIDIQNNKSHSFQQTISGIFSFFNKLAI